MAIVSASCWALALATAVGESAVEVHSGLPAHVTVWCIGNPAHFRVAAEALEIEVGQLDGATRLERVEHGGLRKQLTLLRWAMSPTERDVRDFDDACEAAFAAFKATTATQEGSASPPEVEVECECKEREEGNDDLSALEEATVGAVLGALFGAGGGLFAYRRRTHREDGEAISRLDAAFQSALASYLEAPNDVELGALARVAAFLLRAAADEWRGHTGPEDDVGTIRDRIGRVLGDYENPEAPYIGKLGGDEGSTEREGNAETMRSWAADIHRAVASLGDRIGKTRRLGGRVIPREAEPREESSPEDETGVST